MALLLASMLFFLHASLLIELGDVLSTTHLWLTSQYSVLTAGKVMILSCFVILFIVHFAEAAAWGFFFWHNNMAQSFPDGVYYAAVSVTSVGYGDMVLPAPWRLLGPLAAINGTLMFGCSTAFLFLVLQNIWSHQA